MATGQYNNNNPNNPNGNRGRRPTNNRRKEKVPGAVIAIYVMMAVLVLAICALIFVITLKSTGWNGENQSDSSGIVLEDPSDDSSDTSEPNGPADSADDPSDSSWVVDSGSSDISDTGDSSQSDSDSSDISGTWEPNSALPTDYDPAMFENDLFIGDSIFTGLYLYGYMDAKNVAAAVGYTPYKALYSAFGQTYSGSAADYAAEMQPKRIFIMLGSNTMSAGTNYDLIVTQYGTLLSSLKQNCPNSTICVISIPPVTADSSSAASANISNDDIDSVNVKIRKMAEGAKVGYLDINKTLSDENGYFLKDYAEMDGLHFKGTTYKVLLSALQTKYGG